MGQINCTNSMKLVCEYPFATGLGNNTSALNGGKTSISASTEGAILDSALATQLSQLPLATASAGTVVIPQGGAYLTLFNLGPILVDRAQPIERGKIFWGFTASQYVFTDIDGKSLGSLPFGYSATADNNSGTASSITYTSETTKLSFVADQFVGVVTLGVTKKMDMSLIVPVLRVSVGAYSLAPTNVTVNANGSAPFVQSGTPTVAHGSASGVGDGAASFKYMVYSGERSRLSAGTIVRAPTGDALNFLGSGAWGFNPYLVYGYLARFSPHMKIGYQWNTKTELNNPSGTAGGNLGLPGGLEYNVGGDWAMSKRFTVALDLLGNQFLNSQRLIAGTIPLTNPSGTLVNPNTVPTNSATTCGTTSCTINTTTNETASYTISDLSTGFKWNPGGNLVLSANLLTQLNNNGMRARPTPLLGISYKF